MNLDEVIERAIELPLDADTNVARVAMRGDKACFLTDCDVSTCRRLESCKRSMRIIEGIGKMMVDSKAKDGLREAYRILKESTGA